MEDKKTVYLSSIDPIYQSNIPDYTEEKARAKGYVNYGKDNKWPNYLWDLYLNVATLQSIINTIVDYVCGESITGIDYINKTGETLEDIVKKLTTDYLIFGGFAIQVIRNYAGEVAEIYALDFMKVRTDEKNEIFYYCDNWSKWGAKSLVYPKFGVDDTNPTSIFYYKGTVTRGVYPTPIYGASLIACELEKAINEYHLNNINNGFATNLIINFNNGNPNDEQKKEIERDIVEKFTGYKNAGRFLVSFNDSAENATTIERLTSDDFDDKYRALAERSRNQILQAFRCPEVLVGGSVQSTGFNDLEFDAAFRLYNKTMIQPIQKTLITTFEKIFGKTIYIEPFSIKGNEVE